MTLQTFSKSYILYISNLAIKTQFSNLAIKTQNSDFNSSFIAVGSSEEDEVEAVFLTPS